MAKPQFIEYEENKGSVMKPDFCKRTQVTINLKNSLVAPLLLRVIF